MLRIHAILLMSVFTVLLKSSLSSSVNCCSLTEAQLKDFSLIPSCPSGSSTRSSVSVLNIKCDECPQGTCRVNFGCFCPQDFLQSNDQQQLCAYSFGENWPRSLEKEDTTWRSCVKEPPSTTTDENCCSLTKQQLEARVGTSNLCPKDSASIISGRAKSLSTKCDRCPFGTCRIDLSCYCPKDFLESDFQQELCRTSFTERWDESVGLEDRHWRSCVRPTPSSSFTFDSCCALSTEQLDIRTGTSNSCPRMSSSTISGRVEYLDDGCDPCPFGTCRAGTSCYCPQDFLLSDPQKELCRESFGEVHPDSVGKPDTLCPSNPPPELLSSPPKPSPKPPDTQTAGAMTSNAPQSSNTSSSDSPAPLQSNDPKFDTSQSSSNSGESSNPSQAESAAQGDKGSEDEESENLTTAEKVGIVIGSVTGIISAITGVVALLHCRRKKGKQDHSDFSETHL